MKLTNGTDTIELTDKIQIRAYLSAGYTKEPEPTKEIKKPATRRGGKNGDTK